MVDDPWSSAPTGADRGLDWPQRDADVRSWVVDQLGLDGIVDLHVHELPDRLQAAVWRFFDDLTDPAWPIHFRDPDADVRRDRLSELGVVAHTGLAYAHRPGMVGWLNDHTLGVAAADDRVVPTFTIFPEDDSTERTTAAIARGGRVVKVHLQVGRFATTDPRLAGSWAMIERHRLPVVLHAGATYGVEGGEAWCGLGPVRALLERHPDLVVVLAHLGMPDVDGAMALAEQGAVHLDQAMTLVDPPFLPGAAPALADHLERIAALHDRIVFGSDYPSIPQPYAALLRGLAPLGWGRDELRAVLADNARRLLAGVRDVPPAS